MSEDQACKKCGLEIVGGHAYELGDDRWHIQCFTCSKCSKSLGCNSNFLVLGNGSLICLECSYNCKQCGKKIDDLAILTGDQAYCSSCFRCRVCKLKIEDLRYARTSKGLFCMSCHERLIAKKKKYDLKRRQMAQLELLLRPDSLDVSLNKQLPPHPALRKDDTDEDKYSETSKDGPYLEPRDFLARDISNISNISNLSNLSNLTNLTNLTKTSTPAKDAISKETPSRDAISRNAVSRDGLSRDVSRESLLSRDTRATSRDASPDVARIGVRDIEVGEQKEPPFTGKVPSPVAGPSDHYENNKLGENKVAEHKGVDTKIDDPAKTPVQASTSNFTGSLDPAAMASDIEEVNDSEDELKLRRVRERLERRFSRLQHKHDSGAILDLIGSFSGPNTPNLDSPLPRLGDPPRLDSPHKNFLLLSPGQYHDNGFHAAELSSAGFSAELSRPSAEDLGRSAEDGRREDLGRRSTASSPMARANRQARVVEPDTSNFEANTSRDTNVDTNTSRDSRDNGLTGRELGSNRDIDTSGNGSQLGGYSNFSTIDSHMGNPDASLDSITQDEIPLGTPQLRTPRHAVSPPPRIALPDVPDVADEPRGLGLDLGPRTVTNLEATISRDDDRGGIKQTVRRKMLIKHKRSISGGLGGLSNKFGFFKNKDEARLDKGHLRHVSEGSVHGLAFSTPPLPLSLPYKDNSRGDSEMHRTDLEMRLAKLEIYQLENYKQNLIAENMKLNSDKNKLFEAIKTLQKKIATETQTHELLLRDINEMVAEKKRLSEENRILADENSSLADENSMSRRSDVTLRVELRRSDVESRRFDLDSRFLDNDAATLDAVAEDGGETQRATRLRFWRRPRMTPGDSSSPALAPSPSSLKMSTSVSSNTIQSGNEESGARKALNTIISKSRLTTVLDAIANGSSGPEVPLFSSTIQRRAIYENEKVPLIVSKCIEEVEKRGLDVEGIYRISGGNTAITAIENAFAALPASSSQDKRLMARLQEVLAGDINAVTSALKRYLRKLPDPLIPYNLYDGYILVGKSTSDINERCNELSSQVVARLPPANRHVLYLVAKHLDLVNYYSSVNRMNFKNLSVVFAPTIARDVTGEREMTDMGPRNEATELLFTNFAQVFEAHDL